MIIMDDHDGSSSWMIIMDHHHGLFLGMNGVAVARYGLILWENEAMGSSKVLKYLPDLREVEKKIEKYR